MSRGRVTCYMRGRGKHLRELAAKINSEHSAAHAHARQAIEHAAECGRRLIEAKAECPHGDWLPWLEANTNVGARQSQKYMRLAEGWAEIEAKCDPSSHLNLSYALELIAAPVPDTAPEPDPRAVEIGFHWRHLLVSVGDFARCARELREKLCDDTRLKAALMLHAGAGKAFVEKIPQLCDDQADDATWVDAFLDGFVALADSYSPPPGNQLLHGTEEDLNALVDEVTALKVEVETAGVERLLEIIERCQEIQLRSYRISRAASEAAAGLSNIANMVAPA